MYKKEMATALKFTKEELGIIDNIARYDCTHIDCNNCECRFSTNYTNTPICFHNLCGELLESLKNGGFRK